MQDPKQPAKPDAGAQPAEEAYSEEETERRRDVALKRLLEMPPKPRKAKVSKRTKASKPKGRA